MRGADTFTESLFTMGKLEDFIPVNRWRYKLAQKREKEVRTAQSAGKPTPKFADLSQYKPKWTGLFHASNEWQTRFYQQNWANFTERLFWVSSGEPLLPLLPPTTKSRKKVTLDAVRASRRASAGTQS